MNAAYTSLLWCKSCSWVLEEFCYLFCALHNVVWHSVGQILCLNSCTQSMGSIPLEAGLVIYAECSILCGLENLIRVVLKRVFCSHTVRIPDVVAKRESFVHRDIQYPYFVAIFTSIPLISTGIWDLLSACCRLVIIACGFSRAKETRHFLLHGFMMLKVFLMCLKKFCSGKSFLLKQILRPPGERGVRNTFHGSPCFLWNQSEKRTYGDTMSTAEPRWNSFSNQINKKGCAVNSIRCGLWD